MIQFVTGTAGHKLADNGVPQRARSPMQSRILCRTGSSAHRNSLSVMLPSLLNTTMSRAVRWRRIPSAAVIHFVFQHKGASFAAISRRKSSGDNETVSAHRGTGESTP